MLSHLRMTSICKHLKGQYLHSTIPVEKNQNGLDTLGAYKLSCQMVNT